MAQATKCVYDALACPPALRWLLMMRRFSSSTLTGMVRMEVAVGTPSDASMLAAIFAAAPRRGVAPGTARSAIASSRAGARDLADAGGAPPAPPGPSLRSG